MNYKYSAIKKYMLMNILLTTPAQASCYYKLSMDEMATDKVKEIVFFFHLL